MFDKLLGVIAPHSCCGCGITGAVLCEHCIEDINSEPSIYCLVCERPAVSALCQPCRRRSNWADAWVVGQREGVLKRLIDIYKFERTAAADDALAELLARTLPILPPDTVCTYIPASGSHRRQRGYDHMQRVARSLARKRNIACIPLLERRIDVEQRGFTRAERLQRQKGAFAARPAAVDGPILLIDDIYTTGGTIQAATQALRKVYSQPIYVAVIARQPSQK